MWLTTWWWVSPNFWGFSPAELARWVMACQMGEVCDGFMEGEL